ncbi:MAG: MFS transporter [Paracoccaceae bacterium]|nr:MFS transporter [Paracoccaceae bacterium]
MTDTRSIASERLPLWAVVGPIAASAAFVLELTLTPLLLPAIQVAFALSDSQLAWVFNAYGAAVAAGVLLGGWLGDGFGIRKVFSLGVLAFSAGAAVVALAGSYELLIAGRVLQGFGAGVFSPLVPVLLTRAFANRPGKALILWGSLTGFLAAFTPILFSAIVADTGWQAVFVLFAVVSLAALLATGSAGSAGAITAPQRDVRALIRARDLWLMFAYIATTYGAITFYLFGTPLWLAEAGHDLQATGVVLTIFWLTFSLSSMGLRNLVDGPYARRILLGAPFLIAASFPMAFFSGDIVWIGASAVVIALGFAASNAPSTQMVLHYAPDGTKALSASLDITFARAGGFATVAWCATAGVESAALAMVAVAVLGALALLVARKV